MPNVQPIIKLLSRLLSDGEGKLGNLSRPVSSGARRSLSNAPSRLGNDADDILNTLGVGRELLRDESGIAGFRSPGSFTRTKEYLTSPNEFTSDPSSVLKDYAQQMSSLRQSAATRSPNPTPIAAEPKNANISALKQYAEEEGYTIGNYKPSEVHDDWIDYITDGGQEELSGQSISNMLELLGMSGLPEQILKMPINSKIKTVLQLTADEL